MLQRVKAAWFEGEGNHDKLRCIFINLFPSCRRDIWFSVVHFRSCFTLDSR